MIEDIPMTARDNFQRELAGEVISLIKDIDRNGSEPSGPFTAQSRSFDVEGASSIDSGC